MNHRFDTRRPLSLANPLEPDWELIALVMKKSREQISEEQVYHFRFQLLRGTQSVH
jgi:hypothetical protein